MPKTPVDTLIHAGWILPIEPTHSCYSDHAIAIKAGRIVDLLPSDEANQRYRSHNRIELPRHALMPGLINTHGHAAMSLFRGLADDLPLMTWLNNHIWPAEQRWVNDDFVAFGTELAIAEMLLSGTTCFSDMYFFPNQVAKAAHKHKIRAQIMAPVIEFPSAWASNPDQYIHKALELHDRYRNHELITIGFGPHATYTVDDASLQRIGVLAEELDINIQIHLHETAGEVEQAIEQTGRRPLMRLNELDMLSPRLQCVHMTQLVDEDFELLKLNGCSVVHCPRSNLKLASGFCPVKKLMDNGIPVSLGTDGAASNNSLDMFAEMQMASLLAKGVSGDPTALNAHLALEMATLQGAKTLGLDKDIGSLLPDKAADIIAIDMSHLNQQPVYDLASQLVYTQVGRQVSHTWVNGQLLVENGQLRHMDTKQLNETVKVWRAKIAAAENQQTLRF